MKKFRNALIDIVQIVTLIPRVLFGVIVGVLLCIGRLYMFVLKKFTYLKLMQKLTLMLYINTKTRKNTS